MSRQRFSIDQQRSAVDQVRQLVDAGKLGGRQSERTFMSERLAAAADSLAWLEANKAVIVAAVTKGSA